MHSYIVHVYVIHLMLCVFFLWCFFLSVVVGFFFLRYVQNENAHTCHLFVDGWRKLLHVYIGQFIKLILISKFWSVARTGQNVQCTCITNAMQRRCSGKPDIISCCTLNSKNLKKKYLSFSFNLILILYFC